MTLEEASALLELSSPFTEAELKKAYRHALIVWHPDRFPSDSELRAKAHERTCRINEAFDLLSRALKSARGFQNATKNRQAPEAAKPPQPQAATERRPAETKAGTDKTTRHKWLWRKALVILISVCLSLIALLWIYDFVKTRITFQTAKALAEQGNPQAQSDVGGYYYVGRGVAKDRVEAVKWYRKAAEHGVASAQYSLASCYENGVGVNVDEDEAVKWYRKALGHGDWLSSSILTSRLGKIAQGVQSRAKKDSNPPESPPVSDNNLGSLTHLSTDNRLSNGSVIMDLWLSQSGKGKLTLDNGLAEDAYVKLVSDGILKASFYVRGGGRFTFSHIPNGTHEVLYCTGYGWDAVRHDFARGRKAHRYDLPLTFATTRKQENGGVMIYTDVLTLTLHKVAYGNAKTTVISLDEFDKY